MYQVVVAERLRRQTRNLLGSARTGSNPVDCGCFHRETDWAKEIDGVLNHTWIESYKVMKMTIDETTERITCRSVGVQTAEEQSEGLCEAQPEHAELLTSRPRFNTRHSHVRWKFHHVLQMLHTSLLWFLPIC